jgi:hypothetical protein
MTNKLELNRDDPLIYIKAYGGIEITGIERSEVGCEIAAPQLATLVEENGRVYVTANATCQLTVPQKASIQMEKGMGSVKISGVKNDIRIEKVLGNLVLNDVSSAHIEKVGGNFSVRSSTGEVHVEKVAGNLTIDNVTSFYCQKVGGNCRVKDVTGDFRLEKAGGKFSGQDFTGPVWVEKVGGSFIANGIHLSCDLRVGGSVTLQDCIFSDGLSVKAGGDIEVGLNEQENDLAVEINSGESRIQIKTQSEDSQIDDYIYHLTMGKGMKKLSLAAGGHVIFSDRSETDEDIVGDLSDYFHFEESAFSELIHERVEAATKQAEAKVRSAQIRLERMKEDLGNKRGFKIDLDLDDIVDISNIKPPVVAPPTVAKVVGKKGASDEERLMILKMLQDKKITVDEAETLFKALED